MVQKFAIAIWKDLRVLGHEEFKKHKTAVSMSVGAFFSSSPCACVSHFFQDYLKAYLSYKHKIWCKWYTQ